MGVKIRAMTDDNEDESPGSTVCFAHMLVDGHDVDPQTWKDVSVFRKAERQRLYAERQTVSATERKAMSGRISQRLTDILGDVSGQTIAVYWPIRGEVNLRPFMAEASGLGARICLPVVIEKNQPVEFHRWTRGSSMAKGVWNIPVPADAVPVVPDVVIVPLLGVDENGYRLGNGGGYYDRTLARLPGDLLTIGVGQPFARMKTIFPMPWDIPMKKVVLGDGSVSDHSSV
ncbi:MAG: 5-formyltetrahydrofolate cyclo-ligase [Hoeflea sp.]|uniref:5-formyltetrahydrofolate cyclo-ligase n=1 Tax=Hoeflea sp. TaxID=1940281 RepID=UPI003EF10727